jgi:hypothetical protein
MNDGEKRKKKKEKRREKKSGKQHQVPPNHFCAVELQLRNSKKNINLGERMHR